MECSVGRSSGQANRPTRQAALPGDMRRARCRCGADGARGRVVCGQPALDRYKLTLRIALEADEEEASIELPWARQRGFVIGETSTENPLPAVDLRACRPNMGIGWDRQHSVLPSFEVTASCMSMPSGLDRQKSAVHWKGGLRPSPELTSAAGVEREYGDH